MWWDRFGVAPVRPQDVEANWHSAEVTLNSLGHLEKTMKAASVAGAVGWWISSWRATAMGPEATLTIYFAKRQQAHAFLPPKTRPAPRPAPEPVVTAAKTGASAVKREGAPKVPEAKRPLAKSAAAKPVRTKAAPPAKPTAKASAAKKAVARAPAKPATRAGKQGAKRPSRPLPRAVSRPASRSSVKTSAKPAPRAATRRAGSKGGAGSKKRR